MPEEEIDNLLICSLDPYFLSRSNSWIGKNKERIISLRKTNAFFRENTFYLQKGDQLPLSPFLRKLDELGYEKVFQVERRGEFAQRGGIVDVFPVNMEEGARIEFWGKKIKTILKIPLTPLEEKKEKEILKKKLRSKEGFLSLKNLKRGDYIVHLDHGVGKFLGLFQEKGKKYYLIEYEAGDRLYVPFELKRKLSAYVGFQEPKISRLGSILWQKRKREVREETRKLAKELLKIYAQRELIERPPYLPDDELDRELALTFEHKLTRDQELAIEEVKKDLERKKPMDRLLCGDTGFGKTEVALRAMLKVVKSGFQVAMLCPTTILVEQHFQNFQKRLKNFPLEIAKLSRLTKKKEREEVLKGLEKGKIDFVIGTKALLSEKVKYKKLGLLIIDDEHKFGVREKEKKKKMRASLDVLSLSATPIPRTLYFALSSLREMTLIKTPPPGRKKIKTFILPFSLKTIKKALEREIKRKGQVYYLENNIKRIEETKRKLEKIFPQGKYAILHRQMKDKEILESVRKFWQGKVNILITTTIIEAGIDLPKANTLIVSQAENLGLAQAYQLRGRVGRGTKEAFAYFFYKGKLKPKAKLRLEALKEINQLGASYKIALRDMEIRGGGNILGKEQSGNINKVGLNLYCQMLAEEVERIKYGRN